MEKIHALIEKLQTLKQNQASLNTLSYYAQLLYAEILHAKNEAKKQEELQKAIAVVLPPAEGPVTEKEKIAGPLPRQQTELPLPANEANPADRKQTSAPSLPDAMLDIENIKSAILAKKNMAKKQDLCGATATESPSLNELLKENKLELAEKLSESPIPDLRNAIGINDKFRFVNELFRGDHDMYERSIATINRFTYLKEAEYWIQRELKIKLGWLETSELVQAFYALVRKRFAAM